MWGWSPLAFHRSVYIVSSGSGFDNGLLFWWQWESKVDVLLMLWTPLRLLAEARLLWKAFRSVQSLCCTESAGAGAAAWALAFLQQKASA